MKFLTFMLFITLNLPVHAEGCSYYNLDENEFEEETKREVVKFNQIIDDSNNERELIRGLLNLAEKTPSTTVQWVADGYVACRIGLIRQRRIQRN